MTGWFTDASLLDWTVRLLHVAAVGQTLFVLLWCALPWWRSWVGRALMVKAAALAVYLDFALVMYYEPLWPHAQLVGTVLFAAIAVGIWSQLVVLAFVVVRARRSRRGVLSP